MLNIFFVFIEITKQYLSLKNITRHEYI